MLLIIQNSPVINCTKQSCYLETFPLKGSREGQFQIFIKNYVGKIKVHRCEGWNKVEAVR